MSPTHQAFCEPGAAVSRLPRTHRRAGMPKPDTTSDEKAANDGLERTA